ncbi:MAG TPA: DUF1330 domain-containing protein [Streptosporangiaceae bacterium]
MTAYVMAHVHSTNFGPEIIEYLRTVDATMEPFGGRFLVHGGPVDAIENTTADTIIFDGLPAHYLAKSALEHALSDTE